MKALRSVRAMLTEGAFVRSSVTSALATLADFLSASGLHHVATCPAWLATFLGCVVGGAIAFTLNRVWAFRARDGRRMSQLVRFLFVWATSALLNAAGVELVLLFPGLSFVLGWWLVRGLVYTGWNYPMLRFFVFTRARPRVRVRSAA